MEPQTIVLGIDCATTCGWALVSGPSGRERLLEHGVMDLSSSTAQVVSEFVARLRVHTNLCGLRVVVELPYLGKNIVTLRTLARLCGRFEQSLEAAGADVDLVMADHWQRTILGKLGGHKRDDRKKAAKIWAMATFRERLTGDEADAAALATCTLRERAFERRRSLTPAVVHVGAAQAERVDGRYTGRTPKE
jgi:Holliday junction resolvasome RuvABC endonuclease subunit